MFRCFASCQRAQSSLKEVPRNDGIKFIFFIILFFIFFHTKNCYAEFTDPTRPPSYTTTGQIIAVSQLTLDSIIIGSTRRLAIINGQTVQRGDTITGYKVLEIQRDAVRLMGPNGAFVLPLFAQNIKTPTKSELVK